MLAVEPAEALHALVSAFTNAARAYAEPVDEGEWWDRPAVPFHVVLQTPPKSQSDWLVNWIEAGAQVVPLEICPEAEA